MDHNLIKKLAEQASFTYTARDAITTVQNGVPIEALEAFARQIVLECANLFEDDGSLSSLAEYVHNNRVRDRILERFGVEP